MKPQVNIYPNPNSGKMTLHFENMPEGMNQFIITDVLGKVIFKQTSNEERVLIDNSFLTQGIYLITFTSSKGQILKKKFQVQH